ncbi:MAG: DUF418 domain-containing protein [Silanimonas sp.]
MIDTTAVSPTAERDRLPVMDILRGFALLGIFLMNIEFFTRPLQSYAGGVTPSSGLDQALGLAIYVLVQGKFWVLFALLFGMGFALMRERAAQASRPFAGMYLRRTLLLAVFGLLHAVLVWVGDVLFAYAITALFLLLFMWVRGTAAWVVGASLYLLMAGFWVLSGVGLMFMPESMMAPVAEEMAAMVAEGERAAAVYRDGGFGEITAQRLADFGFLFSSATAFQVPMMLGVFLVGSWLAGTGRLADPAANRGFFVKLAIGGLLFGALGVGASLAFGTQFDLVQDFAESTAATGVMAIGNLPLALAYLSIIVLLASGPLRSVLALLAPAGRMALTNYLMQSVIASLVFYGYGLGLWGEIGRTGQVAIVLVVFAAQVAFSHWWLARFRYGPMEWLWRAGTYLHWPPMRRMANA